jgi:hypothetical protein
MNKFVKSLFRNNKYSFSGAYFSHRQTEANNESTPFDFTT